MAYLVSSQRADGAWLPLWFGHEAAPQQENPVYGTAQVVLGLGDDSAVEPSRQRGREFLRRQQNPDGGWGGALGTPSSMEETALALAALGDELPVTEATQRGAAWLVNAVEVGAWREPAPIGLYFARLWYFERLYPLVFAVSALGRLASERR